MTPVQKRVWTAVIERDEGLCICGIAASQVHHIVPRSRGAANWVWQAFNMLCLCPVCHGKAHTRQARIDMLAHLAEKFGYVYVGKSPFGEYLSAEPVLVAA